MVGKFIEEMNLSLAINHASATSRGNNTPRKALLHHLLVRFWSLLEKESWSGWTLVGVAEQGFSDVPHPPETRLRRKYSDGLWAVLFLPLSISRHNAAQLFSNTFLL